MTRKEGTLAMQSNNRWAIMRPGHEPIEITSGDVFYVEVRGRDGLSRTRMECNGATGAYYSWEGYPLEQGLRAAIGGEDD